ncbi:RodZ domain-containing protein, partial [Bacillus cereus]
GESVSAAGSPPRSFVICKADETEVVVPGQPMVLKAIARENVARFEVK